VGTKPSLKILCIKRRKWQLLGNYVLHYKTIPQSLKILLTKSLSEDEKIFMDLMKSFGNMLGLVPLDPVDPYAPENIPFWWKWNQMPSLII
jgi:hypothetical protein